MSDADDRIERQGRVLGELAELGLAVARGLAARVEAVTSVEDAEKLAMAFHRVSRAVRLTLALESKLAREGHERHEPNESARLDRADARQSTCARKDQVRAAVSRDIWNESEGEAAESLIEALNERLEEDARFAQFLDGPVEVAIARIRKDLGLPANDAGPPGSAQETFPSEIPSWRSSA